LTHEISENPKTIHYFTALEDYMVEKIKEHQGRLLPLIEKVIDYTYDERKKRKKKDANENVFSRPIFNSWGDRFEGATIALNDIRATEVHVVDPSFQGDTYSIDYEVTTLWDHFGLDFPDMEKVFNALPYVQNVFAAWFVLQHLRGYKPFITKITFQKSFKGDIKEGKKERLSKRTHKPMTAKEKQELERMKNDPFYGNPSKL